MTTGKKIEFIDLKTEYEDLKNQINARIQRVLNRDRYIMRPDAGEPEERLAEYVGVRHCITASSGTERCSLR